MNRNQRRQVERQLADAEGWIVITVHGGGRAVTVDTNIHAVTALNVMAIGAQKLRLRAQEELRDQGDLGGGEGPRGPDGGPLIKIVPR